MIINPRTNRQMKIGSSSHKKAVRDGYMDSDTLQIYTPKGPEIKDPEIKERSNFSKEKMEPTLDKKTKSFLSNEPKKDTESKKYTYDPEIEEYVAKFKKSESKKPEPTLSKQRFDNEPTLGKKIKSESKPQPPKIDDSFTTEQGVAEICTDIISENKPKFKKLSQTETDELLRKLLYQKLYGEKPKKDKSKLKIKKGYSSSESD